MIISRTPFRISFFGGGTDYPDWYRENGGAVLATSINKYCYLSCRFLPPFFTHKTRIAYSRVEYIKKSHDEIQHPSARATLKYLGVDEGVEIHHDGDLPARTGLGSSSAFTVGLLNALHALRRRMPTKRQLAMEAIHIERDMLKEKGGVQDQVAIAFGGLNKIGFSPYDEFSIQPIIMERDRLLEFQAHLMLCFTGFTRLSSDIATRQIENIPRRKGELARMFEMVDEALAILTGRDEIAEFGKILHESWLIKRTLSEKVSRPKIDQIYEAAVGAGALGGKLLGAGGGGFMVFVARPQDQAKIKERLKKLVWVPFQFESNGAQIIFYDAEMHDRDEDFFRVPVPALASSAPG